jgi:hypothetical protein
MACRLILPAADRTSRRSHHPIDGRHALLSAAIVEKIARINRT